MPSQTIEYVVCHEIKELGVHILVCSVHYTTKYQTFDKVYIHYSLVMREDRSENFINFKFLILLQLRQKLIIHLMEEYFWKRKFKIWLLIPFLLRGINYLSFNVANRVHFDPNDLFSCRELNTLIAHPDDDEKNKPLNELIKSGNYNGITIIFSLTLDIC